jgi:diguanylate cyclase (GGDEF)-like protein
VLKAVGKILHAAPRQIDIAARLGGGRFAVLLPYTDEHGAYLMAERTRSRVEVLDAPGGGRLRMSLGVAGFPRHGASPDAVLAAADAALTAAREAGGDRVMIFQRATSAHQVEVHSVESEPQIG